MGPPSRRGGLHPAAWDEKSQPSVSLVHVEAQIDLRFTKEERNINVELTEGLAWAFITGFSRCVL